MAYLYDLTDTWNAAGTVFNAIKMNVTNTASAAGSKIVSLQVGATDRFTVDKDGNGYFSGTLQAVGSITAPNVYISANSGTIGMQDNTASILAYNATGSGGITNTLRFITAATERMRIDSSGNVGIGTSSPGYRLDVSSSGTTLARFTGAEYSQTIFTGGSQTCYIQNWNNVSRISTAGATPLTLGTNDTERVRIDSSGNLLVGTTAPNGILSVVGDQISVGSAAGSGSLGIQIKGTTLSAIPAAQVQSYIATGSSLMGSAGDLLIAPRTDIAANIRFITGTTPAERMRIDGSGNLLVGKTAASVGTDGVQLLATGYSGFSAAGTTALFLNRNTNDGTILEFGRNGVSAATMGLVSSALTFGTAGSERMRIDSSGRLMVGQTSNAAGFRVEITGAGGTTGDLGLDSNASYAEIQSFNSKRLYINRQGNNTILNATAGSVGIGTDNPAFALDVASATARIRVAPSTATNNALFQATNGGGSAYLGLDNSSGGLGGAYSLNLWHSGAYPIVFANSNTERMRIDSSGNLLVGTTTDSAKLAVEGAGVAFYARRTTAGGTAVFRNGDDSGYGISFENSSGGIAGSIYWTATTTTYTTSSDARLKENIAPADDASALIDAIQVRKFDWKADGSHQRYGMVAQELLQVAPEAVSVPADEEQMMGVDYSKLVPMLVKEIQSLRARVAQLEGN